MPPQDTPVDTSASADLEDHHYLRVAIGITCDRLDALAARIQALETSLEAIQSLPGVREALEAAGHVVGPPSL